MKSQVMRMGNLIKLGMYLLSLWLLFVLIFINKIKVDICLGCRFASAKELIGIASENILPILCTLILLGSWGVYLWFCRLIDESKDGPFKIVELEDKSAEHLVFLATYVIPLVGFGLDSVRQIINLAITLFLLGAIYIKTDLFYANPTLSLLGFKIYNAKLQGGSVILISRDEIQLDDAVNTLRLDKKIFFAKKAMVVV